VQSQSWCDSVGIEWSLSQVKFGMRLAMINLVPLKLLKLFLYVHKTLVFIEFQDVHWVD
jgi:hypothetical protein